MTRHTLIIPGSFPSMNEIIKVSKSHYGKYSAMKKEYTDLVYFHCLSAKLPKYSKIDAIITWYCKNKRKDRDNIMAGQKFIFDGLVKAKVIGNDGWKEIGDVTHRFAVDKDKPRVEIELIGE